MITNSPRIPRVGVPGWCSRERPRARRSDCARVLTRARTTVRRETWRPGSGSWLKQEEDLIRGLPGTRLLRRPRACQRTRAAVLGELVRVRAGTGPGLAGRGRGSLNARERLPAARGRQARLSRSSMRRAHRPRATMETDSPWVLRRNSPHQNREVEWNRGLLVIGEVFRPGPPNVTDPTPGSPGVVLTRTPTSSPRRLRTWADEVARGRAGREAWRPGSGSWFEQEEDLVRGLRGTHLLRRPRACQRTRAAASASWCASERAPGRDSQAWDGSEPTRATADART